MKSQCIILICIYLYALTRCEEDLILVAKTCSVCLKKYKAYYYAKILHFEIPEDTSFASFKFQAVQNSTSSLFSSKPKDVTVYLKEGAPPVINPDGSKFPDGFLLDNRPELHFLEFKSNNESKYINITSPSTGLYFVATFLSYTDPRQEGITPPGLLNPDCATLMNAALYIIRKPTVHVISSDKDLHALLSLPSFKITENNSDAFKHTVLKNHYSSYLDYNIPYKQYNLVKNGGNNGSFLYSFDFPPATDGLTPIGINVTNKDIIVLKFDLNSGYDIGGTVKYNLVNLAFKSRKKTADEPEGHTIIGCIRNQGREIPTWPNKCAYKDDLIDARIMLNNTSYNNTVYIPFPEKGSWYASFRLFCGGCEKCKESDVTCSSSVKFAISSYPCFNGKCGINGDCLHTISDGLAYSTCFCRNNYRGWDCSDDSYANSRGAILLELLLLVLSNLMFLPAVYFAFQRKYYVEAVVYFATFFFSTFYHACDAGEKIYTFCLVRLEVLQFSDFLCGLLSIWITIIAMADLPNPWPSICHIGGAILLAIGVTIKKTSMMVFIVPFITGIVILIGSWYAHYRKTGMRFPSRRYLFVIFPSGFGAVGVGLLIFALLQTKSNYKYLHSLWHILMAVALIILIPDKKTFLPPSLEAEVEAEVEAI